jgi:hypothetical protein
MPPGTLYVLVLAVVVVASLEPEGPGVMR